MAARRTSYHVECLKCKDAFETTPAKVANGNGKYCSSACFNAARREPQPGRVCLDCKKYKDAADFPRNSKANGRLYPRCRDCKAGYEKRRRDEAKAADPEALAWRRIRTLFGITLHQYNQRLAGQDGKCGICGTADPGKGFVRLLVDHDHATGAVRGLLCSACNSGLGLFRDDPSLLRSAIKYPGGSK